MLGATESYSSTRIRGQYFWWKHFSKTFCNTAHKALCLKSFFLNNEKQAEHCLSNIFNIIFNTGHFNWNINFIALQSSNNLIPYQVVCHHFIEWDMKQLFGLVVQPKCLDEDLQCKIGKESAHYEDDWWRNRSSLGSDNSYIVTQYLAHMMDHWAPVRTKFSKFVVD